jgi:hypothetical protein
VEANAALLFETGSVKLEYRFLKKDGDYCWVNDEQRLIGEPDGQSAEAG